MKAILLTDAQLGQTSNKKLVGLLGSEREVLREMFIDEKTPKQFDKLTGMQKKVIRKMGWPKSIFIKKITLKTEK